MLSRLANIFRVPDLRNKVIFTLAVIALYQVGANVPVPGVSWSRLQSLESSASNSGVLGFLNLFSGGALVRLAVFGLGVMPYITSSIIIQLLSTVIPKLEEWRDQGAVGQKKITQTTRYLTVGLALMQSSGLVYAFHGHDAALLGTNIDLIPKFNLGLAAFMVMCLTAGTAFVMWLAELITQRGIGQGMSILIFANVVAAIPTGFKSILEEGGKLKFGVIIAVSIILLVTIVFFDQGQRRIPVTFARRVVGRRMYGGSSTYIPLKVNQSGVIPIIFASSVLYIPVLLSNVIQWASFQNFVRTFADADQPFLHRRVLLPYLLVHVLLRVCGVRPAPAGGPHPQAGWFRARYPARTAHRALLRPYPQPHHRGRCLVPWVRGCRSIGAHALLESQSLPLLRHHAAYLRRCRSRDHAPDRQPADDA